MAGGGRSFLIDTNVVIQLEDDKPVQREFSMMMRLCQEYGVSLCVHEASQLDIGRDRDANRRKVTLSKIAKFQQIAHVAAEPERLLSEKFGAIGSDNDRVDVALLNALDKNAADFLITEDLRIHRRARLAGLQERVLRVTEALDWLSRTFVPQRVSLPYIAERFCYQLDKRDEIFDNLRQDYPEFDYWFERIAARRPCWTLEINGEIAGLVIRKDNEQRGESDATLPGNKILKISTFKVKETYRGEKFGEHLLKQTLWYAQRNKYDLVYLTAFSERQEVLADLLTQYGFRPTVTKSVTGEVVFEKPLVRGPVGATATPLADDLAMYPCFREDEAVQAVCVPIQPKWYRVLFPENDPEPPLFNAAAAGVRDLTPGNTIRKVYLCRTPMKRVNAGDILLFYLSGEEIGSGAVRTVGIVESIAEIRSAEGLLRATGRRSVYTVQQQIAMLNDSSSPVKVIDFILAGHLQDTITLRYLHAIGAFKGQPQSFTRIQQGALARLYLHERLGYV